MTVVFIQQLNASMFLLIKMKIVIYLMLNKKHYHENSSYFTFDHLKKKKQL